MPNITICGTQLYTGKYAFNLSNGGMGDEPVVMASWLAEQGYIKVAVITDYPSQISYEYMEYFKYACSTRNIKILIDSPVSPVATQEETHEAFALARDVNADALVYLGLGSVIPHFPAALEALDWDPPRIMCTAFVGAIYNEGFCRDLEGWVGLDQYDERNRVFADMLQRYAEKNPGQSLLANSATSVGYDIGRCLGIALGRMRYAVPDAVRSALETIRREPATSGAPGTIISFGPQDHRGFKGADYLVLRKAVDGTTEFVGTAPVGDWTS